MARIRTIKPEFWDSPSTAKASPWARLLFIAMWNWADDHGRGTANLKELEGFAFPNDERFTDCSGNTVHFRSLVAEVSECFGVLFYTVDNRPYFEIPTWDVHQRNERRSKQSKYPDPPKQAEVEGVAEIPCNDTETHGVSGTGTGEQGNRGTVSISSTADATDKTDTRSASRDQTDQQFDDWYKHYPKKVGKGQARKAFKAALKKTDLETLHAGLVAYTRAVSGKDRDFIANPATWLNGERWTDEDIASIQRPVRAPEPELPPFIPESQRKYA